MGGRGQGGGGSVRGKIWPAICAVCAGGLAGIIGDCLGQRSFDFRGSAEVCFMGAYAAIATFFLAGLLPGVAETACCSGEYSWG